MINLDEHKIYLEEQKMDVVPLSIAKQAIKEAVEASQLTEVNNAIDKLSKELSSIKPDFKELDD